MKLLKLCSIALMQTAFFPVAFTKGFKSHQLFWRIYLTSNIIKYYSQQRLTFLWKILNSNRLKVTFFLVPFYTLSQNTALIDTAPAEL